MRKFLIMLLVFMTLVFGCQLNDHEQLLSPTTRNPEGGAIMDGDTDYVPPADRSVEEVHAHVIKEGFKLLKYKFPAQLPEMEAHLGDYERESTGIVRSFGQGTIVQGGYLEDHYDVVYHYGLGKRPDFNQSLPTDLIIAIGKMLGYDADEGFQSITHFWNADGGDSKKSFLNGKSLGIYWSFSVENAIQKIRKYRDGYYNCRYLYKGATGFPPDNRIICLAFDFKYKSLTDFYHTGNYTITQYLGIDGYWHPVSYPWFQMSDRLAKNYSYEILGRMAHLLADMGVPAHAHSDAHHDGDAYEGYQNSFHDYTASEIKSWGQEYLNPYVSSDPLRYLMYVVNQMSDHYASNDFNGDDTYTSSGEYSILSSIIPTLGEPDTKSELTYANLKSMHGELEPMVIRAIAGLFYWFAVETGQLPRPAKPLTLSISGPSALGYNKTGTFTACPSGGSGSYPHYRWWKRYDGAGGGVPVPERGDLRLPPSDLWVEMSLWDDKRTITNSAPCDFSLKCEVTDSKGAKVTKIKTIHIC